MSEDIPFGIALEPEKSGEPIKIAIGNKSIVMAKSVAKNIETGQLIFVSDLEIESGKVEVVRNMEKDECPKMKNSELILNGKRTKPPPPKPSEELMEFWAEKNKNESSINRPIFGNNFFVPMVSGIRTWSEDISFAGSMIVSIPISGNWRAVRT